MTTGKININQRGSNKRNDFQYKYMRGGRKIVMNQRDLKVYYNEEINFSSCTFFVRL